NQNFRDITCYSCGKRGHTSKVCYQNQNKQGNYNNQAKGNNQMNYLEEESDDEQYVYQVEQVNDEMYSETDSSDDEQDMYPAPVRRSERNKEKVANNERERRRNEQWANQGQRAQQFNNPVYVQPPQNDIPM